MQDNISFKAITLLAMDLLFGNLPIFSWGQK
jgi:hypothetical protein